MAQMWYNTTIPGVGTGTTMPLPTGGQPRRPQVLERRSDQTRNQAFAETDENLPVRSGYWAMKALIRAADMLRDGVGVVLVLVALASPAAAGNFLWGLGNAGIALQGGAGLPAARAVSRTTAPADRVDEAWHRAATLAADANSSADI